MIFVVILQKEGKKWFSMMINWRKKAKLSNAFFFNLSIDDIMEAMPVRFSMRNFRVFLCAVQDNKRHISF